MAKLNLLKTQEDFGRFRGSKSYQGKTIKIRIAAPINQNTTRFGFIVPKKVLPKVTERNVIKRRLKSILGKHHIHFKSADVLFFPSKLSLKKKFIDLEKETLDLFRRANIWKP